MATIITYPSALEYWLSEIGIPYCFHFDVASARVKNSEVIESTTSRKDIIRTTNKLNFSEPVHVAVSGRIKRASTETVVFHRLPDRLPENSFFKIDDNLYIICPELCFVHAAVALPVHKLVLLANELCAIYIKDETEEYGQRKRIPVTNTRAIRSYIEKAVHIKGIRKARTAIRYALDNSNSPMESRLAVLATLPMFRGGYGLIAPQLNLKITLSKNAAEYLGQATCCCDMGWSRHKVAFEYDSNLTHLDIRQHFKDKKRATALTISGYKVISITAEQIKNFTNVETMFLRVRDMLNMKTREERLDMYMELRRKTVNDILLQRNYDDA